MRKVTSADSIVTINHYKNLLASEGITAFLKNEHFGSIMGEIPFQEIWPELWIQNDFDYDRALELIEGGKFSEEVLATLWTCNTCGTKNEGQFSACWSCSRVDE